VIHDPPKEKRCAHPLCRATVNEHDHCYLCGAYICQKHDQIEPDVSHKPEHHWHEPEEEGNFC